jgi:hypothetical protein
MLRAFFKFAIDQLVDHVLGLVIASCIGIASTVVNSIIVPPILSETYPYQDTLASTVNFLEAVQTLLDITSILGLLTIPFTLIGIFTKYARTGRWVF